jgi:hypothetical protein
VAICLLVLLAACGLGDRSPHRLVDQETRILSDRRPRGTADSCRSAAAPRSARQGPTRLRIGTSSPASALHTARNSRRPARAGNASSASWSGAPSLPRCPGGLERANVPRRIRHHATWSPASLRSATLRDISRSVVDHGARSHHAQRPSQVSADAGVMVGGGARYSTIDEFGINPRQRTEGCGFGLLRCYTRFTLLPTSEPCDLGSAARCSVRGAGSADRRSRSARKPPPLGMPRGHADGARQRRMRGCAAAVR